jgi:hypothetical protein
MTTTTTTTSTPKQQPLFRFVGGYDPPNVCQCHVQASRVATLGSTTETVELLSAEDSIIELGVNAQDTPEQVVQWLAIHNNNNNNTNDDDNM